MHACAHVWLCACARGGLGGLWGFSVKLVAGCVTVCVCARALSSPLQLQQLPYPALHGEFRATRLLPRHCRSLFHARLLPPAASSAPAYALCSHLHTSRSPMQLQPRQPTPLCSHPHTFTPFILPSSFSRANLRTVFTPSHPHTSTLSHLSLVPAASAAPTYALFHTFSLLFLHFFTVSPPLPPCSFSRTNLPLQYSTPCSPNIAAHCFMPSHSFLQLQPHQPSAPVFDRAHRVLQRLPGSKVSGRSCAVVYFLLCGFTRTWPSRAAHAWCACTKWASE